MASSNVLNMTRPVDARRKKYVRPVTTKQPEVASQFRPLPKPLGIGDVRSIVFHGGIFIVAEWFGSFILCELRAGVQVEAEIRSRDVAHLFQWSDFDDLRAAKFYRVEDAQERLGAYALRLLARRGDSGRGTESRGG